LPRSLPNLGRFSRQSEQRLLITSVNDSFGRLRAHSAQYTGLPGSLPKLGLFSRQSAQRFPITFVNDSSGRLFAHLAQYTDLPGLLPKLGLFSRQSAQICWRLRTALLTALVPASPPRLLVLAHSPPQTPDAQHGTTVAARILGMVANCLVCYFNAGSLYILFVRSGSVTAQGI
jgi:hypothetical protein